MNDHGYEPWARANVERGSHCPPEQVAELLANLDKARARITDLEADPFKTAARVFCAKYLDTDVDMVELRGAEHALIAAYRDTDPTLEKTA